MEHEPRDPICVLKVNLNCCEGCQTKLKKKLLGLNGVFSVDYVSEKKLLNVRGKCDPSVLVNLIEKKGKHVEVVSVHKGLDDNKNNKNKNKAKINGKNKEDSDDESSSSSISNDEDECVKHFNGSKEKKKKKCSHHKHEAVALPPIDESICRDKFCTIHRMSNMIAPNNGSMYWNHPASRTASFCGQRYNGHFGMPLQHSYRGGYYAPLRMAGPPLPGYTPDVKLARNNFLCDKNLGDRDCNIM